MVIVLYCLPGSPQISSCSWLVNFSDICLSHPADHLERKEATEKMNWSKLVFTGIDY